MSLNFEELAEKTIQSQYGASPHILGIIKAAAEKIDPTMDIKTFYDKVLNPLTAEGIGLDIWGRIVGANRYLHVTPEDFFGFYGQNLTPFNQDPFFYTSASDYFRLSDPAFRTLIFLKAAANIGNATLPSIKETLSRLFESPVLAFNLINLGSMKIRIVFMFYLTSFQLSLFREYGLLNLGAGVGFEYYTIDPNETFGFNGSNLQPMNQGIFQPYPIQQGA